MRKVILIVLCLSLLLSSGAPVFAEGENDLPAAKLSIETEEDFLQFAEKCRLDSYSQNLTVYLNQDLNLTGMDFAGIPIFCGKFYGKDHTITGISLNGEGSVQGFFRYLTESSGVYRLHLKGKVQPSGSSARVGSFAGSNSGTIKGCSFEGEVSGSDRVGGFAGFNRVTGIIEDCEASGSIHGSHFVGGFAGENMGVIRDCINNADINAEVSQNKVDLSNITLETISGVEAANTVTDIGGIAGTNGGVLKNCDNRAAVGYLHIGYNVGGIAGSQQGYLVGCRNFGPVFGRKEVGGIVGQMEPVTRIEYTEDTLQILQQQLAGTAALTNQAAANAKNNAISLNGQIDDLKNQADTALDAVESLIPSKENPKLPDKDSIIAAQNAFSSSMTSMQTTMTDIVSSAGNAAKVLESDIRAISGQLNAMSHTLSEAGENLGATFTDVSDEDTEEELSGKVADCSNSGPISGDINAGGIIGAIAWENDLDPEDDIQVSGENSMKIESEIRAVVLNCRNKGKVEAKRRNIGGIAGWVSLGLLKGCSNSGRIHAENVQYSGGIAGNSTGFIRNCSAKCEITGERYVGGIAGSGTVVTDSRSVAQISGASEQIGEILGVLDLSRNDTEENFKGNYYLVLGDDLGAVDGICYDGRAEALPRKQFYSLPGLDEIFKTSTVTFLTEDGTETVVTMKPGEVLNSSQIPPVPAKEGYVGEWENLTDPSESGVFFDEIYETSYTAYRSVIQSEEKRDDGRAVLLAEGEFSETGDFPLELISQLPETEKDERGVEGWKIPDLNREEEIQLRYGAPEEYDPELLRIMIQSQDGNWYDAESRVNESYLVFTAEPGDTAFCVISMPEEIPWLLYIGSGVLVLAVIAVIVILIVRKKKKKNKNKKAE